MVWFVLFNTIFNNISVMVVSFIGGGNQRKPPICRKSLTHLYCCIEYTSPSWIRTHNFRGDMTLIAMNR